jgi:hypothetical protein
MLLPTLSLSLSLSLSPSLWQLLSRINAHASDFIGICTHTQRERERERERKREHKGRAREKTGWDYRVCVCGNIHIARIYFISSRMEFPYYSGL